MLYVRGDIPSKLVPDVNPVPGIENLLKLICVQENGLFLVHITLM